MEGGEVIVEAALKSGDVIGWAVLAVRLGEESVGIVSRGPKQEVLRERGEGVPFFCL